MRRLTVGRAGACAALIATGLAWGTAVAGCPLSGGGTGRPVEISDDQLFAADPPFFVVVGGGSVAMDTCASAPGEGWARTMPHFELGLQPIDFGTPAGGALWIEAQSDCASFMLVLDSHGAWHYGRPMPGAPGPEVWLQDPRPGLHQIWIGSRVRGECNAALRFSAILRPD